MKTRPQWARNMPRKKQYEVIVQKPVTENMHLDFDNRHVEVSLGGKRGVTTIADAGLAKEIDARYGDNGSGDVIVIEVDDRDRTREPGHTYTFSVPDLSHIKWSK